MTDTRNSFLRRFYARLLFVSLVCCCQCCGNLHSAPAHNSASTGSVRSDALNINTASADELSALPHIGPATAERIVRFRTDHGPFARVEHLMLVQGISERRFREIRDLITTE